jgi:hypothetical protein
MIKGLSKGEQCSLVKSDDSNGLGAPMEEKEVCLSHACTLE